MRDQYPPVEPFESGMLDVGDLIYWEVCGNPKGRPALVVHGGPGSGCSTEVRRNFDPGRYRVVLFDQRGCGRSTPHASDPSTSLEHNTTEPHRVSHIVVSGVTTTRRSEIDWLYRGGRPPLSRAVGAIPYGGHAGSAP